jgi:hypothetical protein
MRTILRRLLAVDRFGGGKCARERELRENDQKTKLQRRVKKLKPPVARSGDRHTSERFR